MPDRPDFIPTVRLPPEEGLFQPALERRRQTLRDMGWAEALQPVHQWGYPQQDGSIMWLAEEEAFRWLDAVGRGTA